jgi:hypothetical protein
LAAASGLFPTLANPENASMSRGAAATSGRATKSIYFKLLT